MAQSVTIQDTWTFRDFFQNSIQTHQQAIQTLKQNMQSVPPILLDMKIVDLRALLDLANG